jgi:hypothetical protein
MIKYSIFTLFLRANAQRNHNIPPPKAKEIVTKKNSEKNKSIFKISSIFKVQLFI